MKLKDLEPKFLKITDDVTCRELDELPDVDGIRFLCPLCLKNSGGSNIGVHSIICWRPHVPLSDKPGPGRWEFHGTGFEDLELIAGSSSISLEGGCRAHFFIRNGEIQFA